MFFRKRMIQSTGAYSEQLQRLNRALYETDAIVIGAGAGMSEAAGLTYSGPRFEEHFADFIATYRYSDMYSAGFYPYPSLEEYWAYWSRHIYWNRYQPPGEPYQWLLELVKDKDYFVVTTNVDHCFQTAGFEKERLFYMQGDYGLWQCSQPCCQKTYDNREAVYRMIALQKGLRIPSELVPRCPICGKPMSMNLRCDDTFVQDAGWYRARSRYEDFLHDRLQKGRKVLFLELGVGGNTPAIIKYPFWRLTREYQMADYACINLTDAFAPSEIEARTVCIQKDIGQVLSDLRLEPGNGSCSV